jgi:hypothetical protein
MKNAIFWVCIAGVWWKSTTLVSFHQNTLFRLFSYMLMYYQNNKCYSLRSGDSGQFGII